VYKGGMTVYRGGLYVSRDGMTVHGTLYVVSLCVEPWLSSASLHAMCLRLFTQCCLFLCADGGLYVHRAGMTVFAGGLYVTKNGLTVHDGGALIRSKLSNLSYALNLKLKGNLLDLKNREVNSDASVVSFGLLS